MGVSFDILIELSRQPTNHDTNFQGVALKVKTDMSLQHDVRRSDVVSQYTTVSCRLGTCRSVTKQSQASWVMWVLNFVNLSCAGAMLLYDGSPFHPSPTILLKLAEQVGLVSLPAAKDLPVGN